MATTLSLATARQCGGAIRVLHEEAVTEAEKRRQARWRAGLQVLGVALLLAAIAS
jgi:hypothetical protein